MTESRNKAHHAILQKLALIQLKVKVKVGCGGVSQKYWKGLRLKTKVGEMARSC